jgi:DNA repair protein RadC
MLSKRYHLKLAKWVVVRETAEPLSRKIRNAEDAATLAIEFVKACDDDKEHFWLILLNTKHHYLMHTEVAMGTQSASLVHPREVFGPALREGAAAIIVAHNHPSGDPEPSLEDRELTKRLGECAQVTGITLLDHLIVGNGTHRWISLKERRYV